MPELPIPLGLAFLIAGGLAAFLVVIKLLIGDDVVGVDLDRKFGIFLAAARRPRPRGWRVLEVKEEGGATTTGRGTTSGPNTPF